MILLEDMGQKQGQHETKNNYWFRNRIKVQRVPLPVGDYVIGNDRAMDVIERKARRKNDLKKMDFLGTYKISVDTKENMTEIVNNICGKAHPRFRDECILAQNNGIKLYVLVENEDGITCLEDVSKWQNPRSRRYNKIVYMHSVGKWSSIPLPKAPPTSGETLAKAMFTMQQKYGVEFKFCKPEDAGRMVVELLNENLI